jgi:hypothetical protein
MLVKRLMQFECANCTSNVCRFLDVGTNTSELLCSKCTPVTEGGKKYPLASLVCARCDNKTFGYMDSEEDTSNYECYNCHSMSLNRVEITRPVSV